MQLFSLHSPSSPCGVCLPKKKCRFLNKGLSDFNLALDLGFLTKAHNNTFFKPQFIFYAPYLSKKIGYCRYITVYRDLKTHPKYPCYPSWHQFSKYFENWCQDENCDGDFFSALLKAQPQVLNNWQAKLWSRLYCLSALQCFCIDNKTVSTWFCPCHPNSI